MKRKYSVKNLNLKKTFLAIPAAALMLGVSQGGTTVGLNFQTWYYNSGNTPQTTGFNNGYSDYAATGLPVTTTAFGVDAANWYNTDPIGPNSSITDQACTFGGTATTFAGSLSCNVTAPDGTYFSGAGCIPPLTDSTEYNPAGSGYPGYAPGVWCPPGNDEVLWGEIFGDAINTFSVSISGLAAKFPNGYVIQSMSAIGAVHQSSTELSSLPGVYFTDGTTTNTANYHLWYIQNSPGVQWPVTTAGLSDSSGVFTADTIHIDAQAGVTNVSSALAGFILTDQPVVSVPPVSNTNYTGSELILSAGAIGIPPLSYQWQLNGTPIPGATSPSYTNASLALTDAGNYTLVVNNPYGTTTSETATVTVEQIPPSFVVNLPSVTNFVYAGFPGQLSLTPVVVGSLPLSFQWLLNGTSIAGATNASLTVSNLTGGVSGYSLYINNSVGSTNSATNYVDLVAAPDAYTPEVMQDGPSSYYPLNELSGTNAYDYSGYDHNGAQNGGITLGASGPQPPVFKGFNAGKTAYLLDGSSGYIACGTNASLSGSTDFSVEAWIKTTSTTGGEIVCQRDPNGYQGEYVCDMSSSGSLEFFIFNSSEYQFDITSSKTVNDGNWHYLAFVRAGTTGTIYVDGASVATGSGAVQSLSPTIQTYIGADIRGSTSYFGGSMANVAIYNHALSANRVIDHYITASGIPMIVSLVAGGIVQDSKPAGTLHDGINHGTTWLAESTDFNSVTRTGVEQFDLTNDTQITLSPSTDFDTTNGTICFWVNYASPLGGLPGAGSEAAIFFDWRTTAGTIIGLNASGTIEFQNIYTTNGVNRNNTINCADGIDDGDWHHVAITYDQSSNGVTSVYIDGVLDTQANTPGSWSWPTNDELELGRSHDSYWKIYNGQMDDFRIYNRILTASEVSTIGTESTSDTLIDTNALKVRFDFNSDSALYGNSIVWPYGTLISSPALGAAAVWTPVTNSYSAEPITSPLPIVPSAPSMFYRLERTP